MIFPKRDKVFALIICVLANGTSSYRDAVHLKQFCIEKWHADVVVLSDRDYKGLECVVPRDKKSFLKALNDNVEQYSSTHDVIFFVSGHGYKGSSNHEYIMFKGSQINDYELRNNFYLNMNDECLSLCLIDTCHSGTMLDLEYCSTDGKTFRKFSNGDLIIKAYSYCISACNENETSGEDISTYGGWGGKLMCYFLDNASVKIDIRLFFGNVLNIFSTQTLQASHPILSTTHFQDLIVVPNLLR
jgi:hypothetical protein